MSWFESEGTPLTLCGKTFSVKFSFAVAKQIYKKYGGTEAFMKDFNDALKGKEDPGRIIDVLSWIVSILVNDAIVKLNKGSNEKLDLISEEQVADALLLKDFMAVQTAVITAWFDSQPDLPQPAEDEPENEPEDESEEAGTETEPGEDTEDAKKN